MNNLGIHKPTARLSQNRLLRPAIVAMGLAVAICAGGFASEQKTPQTAEPMAALIRVSLPITGETFERTRLAVRRAIEKAKRENARLTLIVEFQVPQGRQMFGRGSDFGAAYALANFLSSGELNGVRTAAYLPQPIQGHAVLPAIACQEIIMSKDASIGSAGADEATVNPTVRSAYREIAERRRTVPPLVALGMLDAAIGILEVETDKLAVQFVTPEELPKLQERHTTKEPILVKRAGEEGVFSGSEARRLGLAKFLANDRRELLKALELPATALDDDPSIEGAWRAVRVDLKGPIRGDAADKVQRMIEDQRRDRDANFICLWIDSPGGSVADAVRLANFLAFDLERDKVRTVAYIPKEARSDAAIVALACDQVVMRPQAVLGGPGAHELTDEEVRDVRQLIHKKLAPRKGRSWSLMAALVDPRLDVFRATRLGDVEYFSEEELKEQFQPDQWQKDSLVTTPDAPLKLTGTEAKKYRLANHVVDDFTQFRQLYGLQKDPMLVEPGWADFVIDALASPGVAVLLLLIGLAGLYIELHSPGVGIGGFVAAVCFLLFFWSRYLGGTAGWLEATLFIAGIACLLLEVFVIPGFGIFGLGGGALVLISLVLASQTFVMPHNEYQFEQLEKSLLTIAAACLGLVIVAVLVRRHLPRASLFGSMMLEPPAGDEAETIRRREALVDFHDLVGRRGAAVTQLTPGGKARFGDLVIDVLADGEVIERGTMVEVVEVHGNRVLVRPSETTS